MLKASFSGLFTLLLIFQSACVSTLAKKPATITTNHFKGESKTSLYSLEEVSTTFPKWPWQKFRQAASQKWSENDLLEFRFQPLTGGFSSDALVKVLTPFGTYVLRFFGLERPLEKRNIAIESSTWAGANGVGPQIVLTDRDASFFVMKFVDGKTLTLKDTHSEKILRALGEALWKVHHTPPPTTNFQESSQFLIGQRWYQSVIREKNKAYGPSALAKAYEYWKKISEVVSREPIEKAMLHNDPNLRNVMWHEGKITLLDWDLAGIGDPRKELAHVCAWYGLDQRLTEIFLTGYYSRLPTAKELHLLEELKLLILLEFAWVGLSSLGIDNQLDQKTWDMLYKKAPRKTIESLSILQMTSETKPSAEVTRMIFLGLIKQFMERASALFPSS